MPKTLLKDLGMLGVVLGLTLEAPVFAQDSQDDAEELDQQTPTSVQDNGAKELASPGDVRKKQDDREGDTEGGMVKENKAGFGSGGEAMPGTDLPEPPEQEKDKKE